jgi:hypothetical protein
MHRKFHRAVLASCALLFLAALTACVPATPPTQVIIVSTPIRYPTLPPEWTATPKPSATATWTASPMPSPTATGPTAKPSKTPTQLGAPTKTAQPAQAATATNSGSAPLTFSGTDTLHEQPFSLTNGYYVIEWSFTGARDVEFAVVIGVPSTKTFMNFYNGAGPTSGSARFHVIPATIDLTLSVEAFGSWHVTIRPTTGG